MAGYGETVGSAAAVQTQTAANASLADTAFRRAEKRYQLHYEQQLRNRKGRLRGGKLVGKPTDLSDVVDIRQLSACDATVVVAVQLPAAQCPCSDGDGSITALVFRQHPGLVVFPAAVSAQLQLQLIHAALEQWPDPPARTNHTKAHGTRLCQLFQAAQQGLSLVAAEQPPQQQQQQAAMQQPGGMQNAAQDHHKHPQQQHERPPPPQQLGLAHAGQQDQQPPSLKHTQQPPPPPQQQQHHEDGSQQQQHLPDSTINASSSGSSSGSSPWSLGGAGPQASTLLRKLRWVCLGPPYNWTDRLYEPHLPHRPLPACLVQLAQQHAQLALQAMVQAQVQAVPAGVTLPAAGPCEGRVLPQAAAAAGAAPRAGSEGGGGPPSSSSGGGGGSSFQPDAALVNYYHAGDTLNGHKDDVERDLSQPIVTLSLGCDAVFLVGGVTRDVEPTALLLRSGDVVVMGQQARACYHGVPRVLTDRPLPPELAANAGLQDQACLQHMQGCRINISIRSTV